MDGTQTLGSVHEDMARYLANHGGIDELDKRPGAFGVEV